MRGWLCAIVCLVSLPFVLWRFDAIDGYTMSALVAIFLLFCMMFWWFERSGVSAKEVALVGLLSALSAASRLPFAGLPGVQPCTFLIACSGCVFGPVIGFMVGALTALISNLFLGQGPWTLFQMLGWGLIGLSAGLCAGLLKRSKVFFLAFGVVWGIVYGWVVNLWFWLFFVYPHTFLSFGVVMLNSLSFDILHAIGNVVFIALFADKTVEIFERYHQRFHVEVIEEVS